VFVRAKQSAKNTVELSQAKQIGLALMMYLGDNDDTMPIFYAYNSIPPAGQPGHEGVEVELLPYTKNKDIFRSPMDTGGPYTSLDVPGATSYWQAYGSSYRFTKCLYTVVNGESTQNNNPMTYDQHVIATSVEFPAETRVMRLEMMPFFSKDFDTDCSRYGYDCPSPWDYFKMWNPTGGSVVFLDGHARFVTAAGQFDEHRINRSGNKSGEAHPTFGTWYWECD
jgi:hypothetical protein